MRISDWSSDVCSSDLPGMDRPESVARPVARASAFFVGRSEERRVGKECVSTCRSRWSPYHYKKKAWKNITQLCQYDRRSDAETIGAYNGVYHEWTTYRVIIRLQEEKQSAD